MGNGTCKAFSEAPVVRTVSSSEMKRKNYVDQSHIVMLPTKLRQQFFGAQVAGDKVPIHSLSSKNATHLSRKEFIEEIRNTKLERSRFTHTCSSKMSLQSVQKFKLTQVNNGDSMLRKQGYSYNNNFKDGI